MNNENPLPNGILPAESSSAEQPGARDNNVAAETELRDSPGLTVFRHPGQQEVVRPAKHPDDHVPGLGVGRMNITDPAVSREFRDALALELTGLADKPAYWRMTQHLLFGTFRDVDTGNLMIPCGLIAAMEGTTADKNYSARKFLDAYRAAVLDFEVAEYVWHPDPQRSKYRSVASLTLPQAVRELVRAERRRASDDRVWMSSGNTWLRKHLGPLRAERLAEVRSRPSDCPQVQALLEYMNSLPPHRFTSALRHLEAAKAAAEDCADAENQLDILGAIQDNVQPFYRPTHKCTRIFAFGPSILGLHASLRRIMTQDWVTADLRSAQLAIVAGLWGIESITDYLRSGRSIWPDLCGHMGVAYDEGNKGAMKNALYALIYGAADETLTKHLGQHFPVASAAFTRFTSHPIIRSLLRARQRQMAKIRDASGAHDAFGNEMPVEYTPVKGKPYDYDNVRSIMACVAQSFELKLLLPVLEAAQAQRGEEHGFVIQTWLHDGFTFSCKACDRRRWQQHLSLAVDQQAQNLGFFTSLEFDPVSPIVS